MGPHEVSEEQKFRSSDYILKLLQYLSRCLQFQFYVEVSSHGVTVITEKHSGVNTWIKMLII